jgi:hypothetical protein
MYKSKIRFFVVYGTCLIIQTLIFFISCKYQLNIGENLVLIFLFCWTQDMCLRMAYPTSLCVKEGTKSANFLNYFFTEILTKLPYLVISFLIYILFEMFKGVLSVKLLIVSWQLSGVQLLIDYPYVGMYVSILLCYLIMAAFLTALLVKNRNKFLSIAQTMGTYTAENYIFSNQGVANLKKFLNNIKEKQIKVPLYVYVMMGFGLALKFPTFALILLIVSLKYTSGKLYLVLVLLIGFLMFVLCLPMVNISFKQTYGEDALHLLNLNMFTGPARAVSKVLIGIGTTEIMVTAAESATNVAVDTIKETKDGYDNTKADVNRKAYVANQQAQGSIKTEVQLKLEAASIYKYSHSDKSNVKFFPWLRFWKKD